MYSIGVDVGTGSARAGVVDVQTGRLCAVHKHDIRTWEPCAEWFEQSSQNIWEAVCTCVREAMLVVGATPDQIAGIAFDATCSLVCVDANGDPVGVDPTAPKDNQRNIILWADHRSVQQAAAINAGGHERLRTVGGAVSPEMELPKILWLKQQLPDAFARVDGGGRFFDLPDWLLHRATDGRCDVRSLCTVVCKWNYDASAAGGLGWDRSFIESIGFASDELTARTIGSDVRPPGVAVEGGVGARAAAELGVAPGTALGVGMIDAHAGGVGCVGAALHGEPPPTAAALEGRLALICGTSTCHMATSLNACFVSGVWGPYYGAMFEGLHLNEGGQSAAGALLDHLVSTHASVTELDSLAAAAGVPRTSMLNARLDAMATARGVPLACLAHDLHVTPDFLGNRSPLADPCMRGGVVGLRLSATVDDLALLYLAAVQALAYQTVHIARAIERAGHPPFECIFACGGLCKNAVYTQTHADALEVDVYLPKEPEAVLLGAAILGAAAGGAHPSVGAAMAAMTAVGERVRPATDDATRVYHRRKLAVFERMSEDQRAYRSMMAAEA